jgi:hypothetical protein
VPPDEGQYPIGIGFSWMFYVEALNEANIQRIPASVGKCPTNGAADGERYDTNNYYQADDLTWKWHPYPYISSGNDATLEVMRAADPFGDEHVGAWFLYAPGSGIFLYTGRTIVFSEHIQAYTYFNNPGDYNNEHLCANAAAAGYDTIQFMQHIDHTNYARDRLEPNPPRLVRGSLAPHLTSVRTGSRPQPCDTYNTGRPGLNYMGVEVVATRMVGTYACGGQNGAPDTITSGWAGLNPCNCDNSYQFLNCDGVPRLKSRLPHGMPYVRPANWSMEAWAKRNATAWR